VGDGFLTVRVLLLGGAKLGTEPLRVNIMLQLNDVEQLSLQHLQSVLELTILSLHLEEHFLLILAHHQIKL